MTHKKSPFSRRDFLKAGTVGAVGLHALRRTGLSRPEGKGKLRTALVGTGIRGSGTWGRNLLRRYGDVVDMVGLCDRNPKRLAFSQGYMGADCPTFTDFDRMFEETRPELVIVTTTDCFHAKYICAAMEKGADVITEKPLATDEKLAQDILDAEKRTGRRLTVAFNYRFGPDAVRIKEILKSGEIGEVTSVDFNYYLDVYHGASYFRRWHGFKQYSGSLLVHKATHHFDLMNWWLAAEPVEVNAYGRLRKYGFNGPFRGERCMTCSHKSNCAFFWDITKDQFLMDLYVKPESEDGYIRDACVFREKINIWDTMNVQVKYHNNVTMSYSLNAFMPYEGFFVGFNGTEGRLDARIYHQTPWKTDALAEFRITKNFKDSKTFKIQSGGGDHWGADGVMQDRIFRGIKDDPLQQSAGTRDGVMSIMIGIAARRSIEQKRPVGIEELIKI
jgi:predicted dehydrogenase